jgi:predicted phage-related endonuclease
MNITNRQTHSVQQGTEAWLRLRESVDGTASEAPAALGVGKYTTRSELLRRKHTGIAEEHDEATLMRFAAGHAAESKARPLAEEIAGDLYPATMSIEVDGLRLLASLDGLTLDDEVVWETKLWNEELAECVRKGADALPAHYTVQMDQELLVSGAGRCLFTCTDGTPERFVSCWYKADPAKFKALLAGWRQFAADVAAYTPPAAAEPAPVGRAPEALPALNIEVTGMVTRSNLAEFKQTALSAIQSVNRNLKTDQDFADARKAIKWCEDIESRIKAAKEHALSQTTSIEALFRTLDEITAEAKRVRLDVGKIVDKRNVEVKEEAVAAARKALDAHIADLNGELAPMRLQPVAADFAGSIKGLRSIASMQDALDTTLANAKIAADTQARGIRANLAVFKEKSAGYEALFADLGTLVHKAADDFALVLQARISAEDDARAKREQKARDDAEALRLQQEQEQQAAQPVAAPTPAPAPSAAVVADRDPVVGVDLGSGPSKTAYFVRSGTGAAVLEKPEPATISIGSIKTEIFGDKVGLTQAYIAEVLKVQAHSDGSAVLYTPAQRRQILSNLITRLQGLL